MDHDVVVREKMTEKYLLNELAPETRDQFEEHFFDCQECALDVRAASEFIERSKPVLAEDLKVVPAPVRVPPASPIPAWRLWLQTAFRPAFAAPALALLLVVVGYQNLVMLPQMAKTLQSPHVLPYASLNVGAYSDAKRLSIPQGSGFLLWVRIPQDGSYASYKADLYNPSGKLEWSLTIPAAQSLEQGAPDRATQDQWPVQVPPAHREAGTYTIDVRGITAVGESKEIGKTPFELQVQ